MQSDEQEIRQLVATWMTATKAGDIDTVLSLWQRMWYFCCPADHP
jgi:ketosteroid isomerase-like protein